MKHDDQTPTTLPKPGEKWRNSMGAIREVRDVDEDGYSVCYSRPAPAYPDWKTELMVNWLLWVEKTGARRIRKASAAEPKDWSYVA